MLCSAYVLIKPLTINNCSSLGISQNVAYPPVQSLIIFFLLSALTCVLTRCSRTRRGFGAPVQWAAAGHFLRMGAAQEGRWRRRRWR